MTDSNNFSIVHVCGLPRISESQLPKLPPHSKFYVRWKRQLRKLTLVSPKHPLTRLFLHSRASIIFEKRRHARGSHWWIIHPFSILRLFWDILMTLTWLFIYATVPYIISFNRISKNSGPEYWNIVYLAYVICLIDVCLNFITAYVSSDGNEILLDPILVTRKYARGYFVVDLISSVPYTWFYPTHIPQPEQNYHKIILFAEFLPLIKIFRLATLKNYVRQINKIFQISHPIQVRIWLGLLALLIIHWSTCITHVFPYLAMHVSKSDIKNSDAYVIKSGLYKEPTWKIYLTSLHIAMSGLIASHYDGLDDLGRLDIVIRCVLLVIGKIYMIYLLVIILQQFESSALSEIKYEAIMHQVHQYILDKKLPDNLSNKLLSYYEYRFHGSYFREKSILSTFSSRLNQEILIHSSRSLLDNAKIFHNLPRDVIESIMSVVKPIIYLKDDIIYKCDSTGDCMYFLVSGTVALITFYGKEVNHLKDGDHFGELVLIHPEKKRLESVIALEVCELLRYDRLDFKRLTAHNSDLSEKLSKVAQQRMTIIKNLNRLEKKRQK